MQRLFFCHLPRPKLLEKNIAKKHSVASFLCRRPRPKREASRLLHLFRLQRPFLSPSTPSTLPHPELNDPIDLGLLPMAGGARGTLHGLRVALGANDPALQQTQLHTHHLVLLC